MTNVNSVGQHLLDCLSETSLALDLILMKLQCLFISLGNFEIFLVDIYFQPVRYMIVFSEEQARQLKRNSVPVEEM